MDEKYLLVVKVPKGLVIRDLPRPQSQGARALRTVPVGTLLYAKLIVKIEGVPYALINTTRERPEWVRVAEADGSIQYVEVIDLFSETDTAIDRLSAAIESLAAAVRAENDS